MAQVRDLDAKLVRLARRNAAAGALVESLTLLITGLTVIGVLAVSVQAAAIGALDRVLIAALALGTMAAFDAVAPLPAAAFGLPSTVEAGRRLLEIAARAPNVRDPRSPATIGTDATTRLENVSFDHVGQDTWGLRDVDLSVAPGARVALVGHSGSGKSTVASLLVRFFDPDAGQIAIGDADVRSLLQRDVRATVSLGDQNAYLFSTTIRENVRLARPEAGDREVEDALRRARAWDWVASLPGGIDTLVGEDGGRVSGGERQRIALARSFLTDAPVLVLDEPTAHLDRETGRALVDDIVAGLDGRAVLLITHDVAALADVDQIVTLRKGRVAGGGARSHTAAG
jgi:ABC-type transport system involved in cytochrome bd biosynthesis fused ATPase/permease subunit